MTTQETINKKQSSINEQTKIDISIRTFYGIVTIVIGMTSFYLYNNFALMSDIKEIKTDLAYIKIGIDTNFNTFEKEQGNIKETLAQTNAKFNAIDQKFTTLKTVLKIDY